MATRYLSLWFRHLLTDWVSLRRPALLGVPFVLAEPDHGRKIITAANIAAQTEGIDVGMVVADARVLCPGLEVLDHDPERADKLLKALALWCIRYTPRVAVDPPDGLILDVSGCAHLWGGERPYLKEIVTRLRTAGYDVRGAMTDTVGAAWGVARFGRVTPLIESGQQEKALLTLPPAALRLSPEVLGRLQKLGLYQVGQIVGQPRSALRRRFGKELLLRLDQAFGQEMETILPVQPVAPFEERLPCLEPICTAGGIEIALTRLLEALCRRLQQEGKGLRAAVLKGYRIDGKLEEIAIGTNHASHNINHLFKLFEGKIQTIEPDLGIEVFVLEAPKVEDVLTRQETLWGGPCGVDDIGLAELLDRLTNHMGAGAGGGTRARGATGAGAGGGTRARGATGAAGSINRYLPSEHYWPERSIKPAASLQDKPASAWPDDRPRPIHLLAKPEPIEVTAPIPDYPPMLFRHKGVLHKITRADGPERIENEWWIEGIRHRDYYAVENEQGERYWLFRSGHYEGNATGKWFLHGFFA
jgi:protein ImuB